MRGAVGQRLVRSMPAFFALAIVLRAHASVSNGPGSRLLMVTLLTTVLARNAGNKAGEAGAGAVGKAEIIDRGLHRRRRDVDDAAELACHAPSTVALISSIGVSMLASSALTQSSRFQSWKSPAAAAGVVDEDIEVGRRCQCLGAACGVVMSPTTTVTVAPVALRIRQRSLPGSRGFAP